MYWDKKSVQNVHPRVSVLGRHCHHYTILGRIMDYLRVRNHAGSIQLQITNQVLPWRSKQFGGYEKGNCSFALESRGMDKLVEIQLILEEVSEKCWKWLVCVDHRGSRKNM